MEEGGRTGLTAATVAVLFLACLMLRDLVALDGADISEVIPACVTALLLPFTDSNATGVSFGFITCAVLKLLSGRAREVKPVVWVIAVVFLVKFHETGESH